MYELETLVVPEELGVWLGDVELGEPGNYFTTIDKLFHYWDTVIGSKTGDFISQNKKEILEVIIGSRGYRVEKPLYYALVKGHELLSDSLKYWNCKAYNSGHLLVGSKYPKDNCINRMTKNNWNKLGINDSNADFIEMEGVTE